MFISQCRPNHCETEVFVKSKFKSILCVHFTLLRATAFYGSRTQNKNRFVFRIWSGKINSSIRIHWKSNDCRSAIVLFLIIKNEINLSVQQNVQWFAGRFVASNVHKFFLLLPQSLFSVTWSNWQNDNTKQEHCKCAINARPIKVKIIFKRGERRISWSKRRVKKCVKRIVSATGRTADNEAANLNRCARSLDFVWVTVVALSLSSLLFLLSRPPSNDFRFLHAEDHRGNDCFLCQLRSEQSCKWSSKFTHEKNIAPCRTCDGNTLFSDSVINELSVRVMIVWSSTGGQHDVTSCNDSRKKLCATFTSFLFAISEFQFAFLLQLTRKHVCVALEFKWQKSIISFRSHACSELQIKREAAIWTAKMSDKIITTKMKFRMRVRLEFYSINWGNVSVSRHDQRNNYIISYLINIIVI